MLDNPVHWERYYNGSLEEQRFARKYSQYLPVQFARAREGSLANRPRALILDKIAPVLSDYAYACAYAGVE
jgi:D-tagatose-1,6-bisphosphate aldolase subunit GatZ/KbaZ